MSDFDPSKIDDDFLFANNRYLILDAHATTVGADSKPALELRVELSDVNNTKIIRYVTVFESSDFNSAYAKFGRSFMAAKPQFASGFAYSDLIGSTGHAEFWQNGDFIKARHWSFDIPAPKLPSQGDEA